MWFDILLVIILTICVATDIKSRRIYNKFIFPTLLIALISHLFYGGWEALLGAFLGFLVGLGILLIPYLLGGMGAGDVKLLALIGAIKGTTFVIDTALYMAILGGLMAIFILLFRPGWKNRFKAIFYFLYALRYGVKIPLGMKRKGMQATYPYGVPIAAGALLCLFAEGWRIL
ncbi:prepilin peptidase [Caldalkalibacillus salinus]|uniref:prepilin peptidase n=1 Tax=Caldalkalibacillus salinus TaxID=2803787 RepID=UPI001923BF8C